LEFTTAEDKRDLFSGRSAGLNNLPEKQAHVRRRLRRTKCDAPSSSERRRNEQFD
jgi:hypothetical protein